MKGHLYIKDETLKSLIKMGANGFYPLFEDIWASNIGSGQNLKLTKKEKADAKKLLQRLEKHKCLDRKRTIVHSLHDHERDLLIRAFLNLVEGEILDARPDIQ